MCCRYWTGSANHVEIDNDFYSAIFKVTSENGHGESAPSGVVVVHPSTQFADDRLKITRAVRVLQALHEMQVCMASCCTSLYHVLLVLACSSYTCD